MGGDPDPALGDSRPLTKGEIAIAKKLFGDSMNYDDIRIQNGKESPLWKASSYIGDKCGANNTCCRAQTICSTIYMPKDQYVNDYSKGSDSERSLFVHEMTHAWQFQNMQASAAFKTVEDVVSLRSYDGVYSFKIDPKKDLGDYNVEQQAGIMEEYYAFTQRQGKPIVPPAPQTPAELEQNWFHAMRLKLLTATREKNPDDPTVAQAVKDGSVSFDTDGKAHFTQAYADKQNESSKDYVASREKSDRDLMQVMQNFRTDPSYLDQSAEVKAGVVVAAVVFPIVVPIVLVGTAAVKINEAATIAMDTSSIYDRIDAQVAEMTAPKKFKTTDTPQLSNYVQSLMSNARFSHHMRGDQMKGDIQKNGDGRITNMRDVDFSIPENRAEFTRMLDVAQREQQKIFDDNSSIWPRWSRSGDSVLKQESARADLKMIEGARRELTSFDREVAAYNRDQAVFDGVFKQHTQAAKDLATRLNCNQDAATVRTAVTQFLHDENSVREKATALPEGAQRLQLLKECDINAASAHYSLASAAETPQQAQAEMQQVREFMQKSGLDPAKEESYKAFGTTKEEFDRRAEGYKKEAAEPAAVAKPGQKGYLSGQFAGVDSETAAPAAPDAAATQQQRLVATR